MRPTGNRNSLSTIGSEDWGPKSITNLALRRSSFTLLPFAVVAAGIGAAAD